MNIYKQLRKKSLPLLEAYETDLAIDQRWIEENSSVPFMHYTRATGTHLVPLPRDSSTGYPAPGVRVKYLFGTADREKILQDKLEMQAWFESPARESPRLILYYDGKTLQPVTLKNAREIMEDYVRTTRSEWALQRKGARI